MQANSSLDRVRIASPCPASWDRMTGDARVRFCDECHLHVYNIAEMTRLEVETVIAKTEGRLCARIYRRADGTVITRDCPVGLRALRRRARRVATAGVAMLAALCANIFAANERRLATRGAPAGLMSLVDPGTFSIIASLEGSVNAPNGDVIQDATVTLINLQTNQRLVTKTDKLGQYHFWVSQFGRYSIEVQAQGFQKFSGPVELHLNDNLRFDVSMEIGGTMGVLVIEPIREQGVDVEGAHIRVRSS